MGKGKKIQQRWLTSEVLQNYGSGCRRRGERTEGGVLRGCLRREEELGESGNKE